MSEESTVAPIDQRNLLAGEPFDYQVYKDNRVQISFCHKPVMVLKGSSAMALIKKLEQAEGKEKQLILAKITGNFKRGNERMSKKQGS